MAVGRKNVVKIDPLAYNTALIGEGGIGKTTVIKEMCEKLVGTLGWDDNNRMIGGYLFAECGKEDGGDAITDINCVNCTSWSDEYDELTNTIGFRTLVNEIIENKNTEYPNLKVLVVDTYDQLRQIVEPEVIRLHNKQHPDKRVTSVKAAFGGYMAGEDMCDDMILDALWELKKVGVHFIAIGHVKFRDVTDAINGDTYSQLTTDMSMRSFNKLKTKLHFLGVASINREISKEKKNGKDKNVIKSESRRITFRDDNYAIDSKSRFAEIVDEIPLDADALIKALTDAIEAEARKGSKSLDELKKEQAETQKKIDKKAEEYSAKARTKKAEVEEESNRDEYLAQLQTAFKSATTEQKEQIKSMMAEAGCSKLSDPELPIGTLKSMIAIFA